MLAAQAKTSGLQTRLASEINKNMELLDEVTQLKQQIKQLSNVSIQAPSQHSFMTVEHLQAQGSKYFKYYTGFDHETFMKIFKILAPRDDVPLKYSVNMSCLKNLLPVNQFLLSVAKLRVNFEFSHLGHLFHVSANDAGRIFRAWINYMYFKFGEISLWPKRQIIIDNMPVGFREDFPTVMVILDGTEIKIERPSSLRTQSQCYSDYKSATTLKGLVGVDPRGSFTFISMLFSGSISDKAITKDCGLLDLLKDLLKAGYLNEGDGVMVDKGFLIKDEINRLVEVIHPSFCSW